MQYTFYLGLLTTTCVLACGGHVESSEHCGPRTHDEGGACIADAPILACGAGTHAVDGACVPVALPAPVDVADGGASEASAPIAVVDAGSSPGAVDYLTACFGDTDRFILDGEPGNGLHVERLRAEGRDGWTSNADAESADGAGTSSLSIGTSGWRVTFSVAAFVDAASRGLRVATYADAELAGSETPNHPGLRVEANGAGCARAIGQFSILQMDVAADDAGGRTVRMFTAAFDEHCEDATSPAVRGCVHFAAP